MTFDEAVATGLPIRKDFNYAWAIPVGHEFGQILWQRFDNLGDISPIHHLGDSPYASEAAIGGDTWEVLEESLETRTNRLTFEEALATGLPIRQNPSHAWASRIDVVGWFFFDYYQGERDDQEWAGNHWYSHNETKSCWSILEVDPNSIQSASEAVVEEIMKEEISSMDEVHKRQRRNTHSIYLPRKQVKLEARSLTTLPVDVKILRKLAKHIDNKKRALKILDDKEVGGYEAVAKHLKSNRAKYKRLLVSTNSWEIWATHVPTGVSVHLTRSTLKRAYKTSLSQLQRQVKKFRQARRRLPRRWYANRILKRMERSLKDHIANYKEPKTEVPHVGIELEFMIPEENLDDLIADCVKTRLARYIELKEDGSVHDEGNVVGREIAFVHPVDGYAPKIAQLCELLKTHEAFITKQCGLHVHMDCRKLDKSERGRIVNNLVACQALLYNMQPESRRNGEWCKRINSRILNSNLGGGDRYYGINQASLADKQTVEIRMHTGTIASSKIIAWVDLLHAIKHAPHIPVGTTPYGVKELARCITLVEHVASYVKVRLRKFKGKDESLAEEIPYVPMPQPVIPQFEENPFIPTALASFQQAAAVSQQQITMVSTPNGTTTVLDMAAIRDARLEVGDS